MKHVWILNYYAQGPGGSGGTRHFALSRYLPNHGWSASVIAASTDHNVGSQRLAKGVAMQTETVDGVTFRWLRSSDYAGNGTDRVRNMLQYTFGVLRERNLQGLQRPDAIIGSSVHPLAAWAGSVLAKRYRVPFLFEVRDLWPQTLIDMGRLSARHPAAIALRRLETALYRRAARTIVLLPKANEYIEPLGIAAEKIVWVPNGADLANVGHYVPAVEPAGEFKLMYFGAHGNANALDTVIEAMHIVSSSDAVMPIRLDLIGDGTKKNSLRQRSEQLGLRSVFFHPPIDKSEIYRLARNADGFVLSVLDRPNLYRFGISMNKLFDYLAAGRPIIMASSAVNNPIADASAGMTVPPENPEALAHAILSLVALPHAERLRMGAAGYSHVTRHYGYDGLAKKLARVLDDCCSEAGHSDD